jgi:hypothetical protein
VCTQLPPKTFSEFVRDVESLRDDAKALAQGAPQKVAYWTGVARAHEFVAKKLRELIEQKRLWELEHPEQ